MAWPICGQGINEIRTTATENCTTVDTEIQQQSTIGPSPYDTWWTLNLNLSKNGSKDVFIWISTRKVLIKI